MSLTTSTESRVEADRRTAVIVGVVLGMFDVYSDGSGSVAEVVFVLPISLNELASLCG